MYMKDIDWKAASECLRILSHPHRLQVIYMLLKKEQSVGNLAETCGILPNVMSEHLSLMKHKGFIAALKKGRNVYYKIKEPALRSIILCIKQRFQAKEEL